MAGYIQVYTGEGKGKTTAALGLAVRAAGANWNVFFGQFCKGMRTSELAALQERFADRITIHQFGMPRFIMGAPQEEDIDLARRGLAEARDAVTSGKYSLVVLDEANVAIKLKLFSVEDMLSLIDAKLPEVELVLTGRDAHPRIVERADLVTEMVLVKHYFQQGVAARKGIEK
jgi:cob(I)alamin adenosyltransferase